MSKLIEQRLQELEKEIAETQKTKTIWERKCLRNWYYNRIKRNA